MADAHVVLIVVSLFTLTLAVSVRGAHRLLHLVVAANAAAQTLPDVVPQLRERARRTRRAPGLLRRRAGRAHEGAGRASVALQRAAGDRVRDPEGEERRGDADDQSGA